MAKTSEYALEKYRKILSVMAFVTVALTFLLGLSKVVIFFVAAALALLPVYLRQHRAVRVIARSYQMLIVAAVFFLLVFQLAKNAYHGTLWALLLVVLQMVLPSAAVMTLTKSAYDVWFMRILGALHAVFCACFIVMVPPAENSVVGGFDSFLIGAVGLVMLVLPFLAYPLNLSELKKKFPKKK